MNAGERDSDLWGFAVHALTCSSRVPSTVPPQVLLAVPLGKVWAAGQRS